MPKIAFNQLSVPIGVDLMLTPGEHVLQRVGATGLSPSHNRHYDVSLT